MSNTNVLKNSLKQLYQDSPEILHMLDQLNYESIQGKWEAELYSRISKEDVALVEAMLTSNIVVRYHEATASAVMACTNKLTEMLEFVLIDNKGEMN